MKTKTPLLTLIAAGILSAFAGTAVIAATDSTPAPVAPETPESSVMGSGACKISGCGCSGFKRGEDFGYCGYDFCRHAYIKHQ